MAKIINSKICFWIKIFLPILFLGLIPLLARISSQYSGAADLIFLILIFVPGVILDRVVKLNIGEDWFDRLAISIIWGFIYLLTIALLGVGIGLTVNSTIWLGAIILLAIWIFWAWQKIKNKHQKTDFQFSWQKIYNLDNIIALVLLALVFFLFCAIDQQGANFKGDPQYHLAVVRKVIGNAPMNIHSLSYVKNQVDTVYVFPLWHIVIGLISKLANFNIINLWSVLCATLLLLIAPIWFFAARQILPTKTAAALATAFLLIFTFNPNAGYVFTRLPVPDAITQFLLLPAVFALTWAYGFQAKRNWPLIIITAFLALLMALVHFLHFFYYLVGIFFLAGFWYLFNLKDSAKRQMAWRMLSVSLFNLIIVIPPLVFLELKGHTISAALSFYWSRVYNYGWSDKVFTSADFLAQLAFLALPLALFFVKKHPKTLLAINMFLASTIILWGPVKLFCAKLFSFVFVNRLFYNLTWYYLIWGLFFAFFFQYADNFNSWLKNKNAKLSYLFITILAAIVGPLVYFERRTKFLDKIYKIIFSQKVSIWVEANYLYLLLIIIALVVATYIIQKVFFKKFVSPELTEPKSPILFGILFIFISFFFLLPTRENLRNYYKREMRRPAVLHAPYSSINTIINVNQMGGRATIDFINQSIPPKSVFDTNGCFYCLPIMVDQYMSAYRNGSLTTFPTLYDPTVAINDKIAILQQNQIQYLLIVYAKNQNKAYFAQYPDLFQLVYSDDKAEIYHYTGQNLPNNDKSLKIKL